MANQRPSRRRLFVEQLEGRLVLSLSFGADSIELFAGDLAAEAARGAGSAVAPQIRLDLVALHEFGHSLGLQHTSDPTSIMYAYYNAKYDKTKFLADSSVTILRSLYANVETSPWKNSLDPNPTNGRVDVSYSFMPDGTALDKPKTNALFSTFDTIFGQGQWQSIFAAELNRWSTASGPMPSDPHVTFYEHSDAGRAFNYSGLAQNDPNAGDVRIGAHRFDGAGKTLAHTYYPPPNGATAAGDAHFDQAEKWVLSGGTLLAMPAASSSPQTAAGDLTVGDVEVDADVLIAGIVGQSAQDSLASTVGYGQVLAEAGPDSAASATGGGAVGTVSTLVAISPERFSLLRSNAKTRVANDLFFDGYEPSDLAGAMQELSQELAG